MKVKPKSKKDSKVLKGKLGKNQFKKKGKSNKVAATDTTSATIIKKEKPKHKWREPKRIKKTTETETDGVGEASKSKRKGKSKILKSSEETTIPKKSEVSEQVAEKTTTNQPKESLRERMLKRLNAARFRQINEDLDTSGKSSNPLQAFGSDPEVFKSYHSSYMKQMESWPTNPLELIIRWARKRLPAGSVIADLGCGEAKLALELGKSSFTVHSYDLFALNDRVVACDVRKGVPLPDQSVDAVVFCLSLMGTDVSPFIAEATRILKINGKLKIAEVASRFAGNILPHFVQRMKKFGFVVKQKGQRSKVPKGKDLNSEEVFLMFEFLKIRQFKNSLGKLPPLKINPSLYKKR